MSKLPFSLTPTVRPLSRNPTVVADPYKELKELLLQSYSLTDEQRTNKWLDYPMCSGDTRPSVLWDNLTALQPATLKEAQIALFIRKLPRHISAMCLAIYLLGEQVMPIFQQGRLVIFLGHIFSL